MELIKNTIKFKNTFSFSNGFFRGLHRTSGAEHV